MSELPSTHALRLTKEFDDIKNLRSIFKTNQQYLNAMQATRFLELMLDEGAVGAMYRACLAFCSVLRSGDHQSPKVLLSNVHGQTFNCQYWLDINVAPCLESFLDNGLEASRCAVREDRLTKSVTSGVRDLVKSGAARNREFSTLRIAGTLVGSGSQLSDKEFAERRERKSAIETMAADHVEQVLSLRNLRRNVLSYGSFVVSGDAREYFGKYVDQMQVSYFQVYHVPESYAQRFAGMDEKLALANLRPADVHKLMAELVSPRNSEHLKKLSNVTSRFPPESYYRQIWPVDYMRVMAQLLESCKHCFKELHSRTGEWLCQVAFGNYMLTSLKSIGHLFGRAVFDVVRENPSQMVTDPTIAAAVRAIVHRMRDEFVAFERSNAKEMPNNPVRVQHLIWRALINLEAKAAEVPPLEDALSPDEEQKKRKKKTKKPEQSGKKRKASVPLIEMKAANGATFQVPFTFKMPRTGSDDLQAVVDNDEMWQGYSSDKALRALATVHARSGAFDALNEKVLRRTPQEYEASHTGSSVASSMDAQATKRSGGYDEEDGSSETEEEEDEDDAASASGNDNAAVKSQKLGKHGKHVHRMSATRMIKRLPVQNVAQTATEMGHVKFTDKAKIRSRANDLDRETLMRFAEGRERSQFERHYAAGMFKCFAASEYLKSIQATATPQIALTKMNDDDVTGLSGDKIVGALCTVANIASKLYNSEN